MTANPAVAVKELRKVELAPQGLDRPLFANCFEKLNCAGTFERGPIFHLFLYCGPRCGDVVGLELPDLMLKVSSGTAIFRHGKGNKQRSVPVPLPARQALTAYLDVRPPVASQRVFIGERGPLTARGIRSLCDKYSALTGVKLHPHLFGTHSPTAIWRPILAIWWGWLRSWGTKIWIQLSRYTKRTQDQLGDAAEKLDY